MNNKIIDRKIYVYDIETLASCFTYTDINIDTLKINQFIIHKDLNQIGNLINHLYDIKGQIGFNNINFDYPIIHYLIKWYEKAINKAKKEFILDENNEEIINIIYKEAQRIIEEQNKENFNKIIAIPLKDVKIPQLDLFKIWHFNNKARATSLKSLQISMNYPNVMDMPISHTKKDITIDETKMILEYNLNDVLSTFEFYKRSKEKIELRKNLLKKYNIPCLNYPDSKIGEELVLKLYCNKTNQEIYDVKKMRTNRLNINLKDCIFDYIYFKSDEFNNLLYKLKSKIIYETKGSIEESVIYKGFKYDYGTGGIHGCIKPGVYESDDDYVIIDCDVALTGANKIL